MSEAPNKEEEKAPNEVTCFLREVFKKVKISRDFFDCKDLKHQYLIKGRDEEECDYLTRINGTSDTGVYKSVINRFVEMALYEPPAISESLKDKYDFDNVDLLGTDFYDFIRSVCESSLVGGVEFVAVETSGDKKSTFFKRYKYEQLVSYRNEGGKLTQLVFKENVLVPKDKYDSKWITRLVVFKINGGEIWIDDGNGFKRDPEKDWENKLDYLPVVSFETGEQNEYYNFYPKFWRVADLDRNVLILKSCLFNIVAVVADPIPITFSDDGIEGVDEETGEAGVSLNVKKGISFTNKTKEGMEYLEANGNGVAMINNEIKDIREVQDRQTHFILKRGDSKTVIDSEENQKMAGVFLGRVARELESKTKKLYFIKAELEGRKISENDTIVFRKKFDDIIANKENLRLMFDATREGWSHPKEFLKKLKSSANLYDEDYDIEKGFEEAQDYYNGFETQKEVEEEESNK